MKLEQKDDRQKPLSRYVHFPEMIQVGKAVMDGMTEISVNVQTEHGIFYFSRDDQLESMKRQISMLLGRTVASLREDMCWLSIIDFDTRQSIVSMMGCSSKSINLIGSTAELEILTKEMEQIANERDRLLGDTFEDLDGLNRAVDNKYPYHLIFLNLCTSEIPAEVQTTWLRMKRLFKRVGIFVYGLVSDIPCSEGKRFIDVLTENMIQIRCMNGSMDIKGVDEHLESLFKGFALEFSDSDLTCKLRCQTSASMGEEDTDAVVDLIVPINFVEGHSASIRITGNRTGNTFIGGNAGSGKSNLLKGIYESANIISRDYPIQVKMLNSPEGWLHFFGGGFLNELKCIEDAWKAWFARIEHEQIKPSLGGARHVILLVDDPGDYLDTLSLESKHAFELTLMAYLPILHVLGFSLVMVVGDSHKGWIPDVVMPWMTNRVCLTLDENSLMADLFSCQVKTLEKHEIIVQDTKMIRERVVRGHVSLSESFISV